MMNVHGASRRSRPGHQGSHQISVHHVDLDGIRAVNSMFRQARHLGVDIAVRIHDHSPRRRRASRFTGE